MQWERLEKHIISPRNKQTWRSSLIYGTTWSPVPVTIHCFYCHIFKLLFVTNFCFYFHFSFSPWRRFVRFFCFILLFTSSSPCRKDQFAVSYFSTSLIVLWSRSTTGRPSTSHWFVAVVLLIRHRNELTEKDWENAVHGLGNDWPVIILVPRAAWPS